MPGPKDFAQEYVTSETLDRECAAWMAEIAAYRWRPVEPIEKDASALVVVDMTRPFVDAGRPLSSPNARAILPRLAELIGAFRAARRPVLWAVQGHHSVAHDRGPRLAAWWPSPIFEGTGDVAPASGLEVAPGEKTIVKRRYSAFYQTDLELTLRNLGIRQVAVAGVLTNVCPFFTAVDAFERDFGVFVPPDATASLNRELHVGALRTLAGWCAHVVPAREIAAMLKEGNA